MAPYTKVLDMSSKLCMIRHVSRMHYPKTTKWSSNMYYITPELVAAHQARLRQTFGGSSRPKNAGKQQVQTADCSWWMRAVSRQSRLACA